MCKPRQEYSKGSYLLRRQIVKKTGVGCGDSDGLPLKEIVKGEVYNSSGKWNDTGIVRLMTNNWCTWGQVLTIKGGAEATQSLNFSTDGLKGAGRDTLSLPGCKWEYETIVIHLD